MQKTPPIVMLCMLRDTNPNGINPNRIVILNLFQDNAPPSPVILKQVQDDGWRTPVVLKQVQDDECTERR
jgi:hypothetical protein